MDATNAATRHGLPRNIEHALQRCGHATESFLVDDWNLEPPDRAFIAAAAIS